MAGERCGWHTDPKIGRWFYPRCMGGAHYGLGGCTCRASSKTTSDRLERLEDQVRHLMELVEGLAASRPAPSQPSGEVR